MGAHPDIQVRRPNDFSRLFSDSSNLILFSGKSCRRIVFDIRRFRQARNVPGHAADEIYGTVHHGNVAHVPTSADHISSTQRERETE